MRTQLAMLGLVLALSPACGKKQSNADRANAIEALRDQNRAALTAACTAPYKLAASELAPLVADGIKDVTGPLTGDNTALLTPHTAEMRFWSADRSGTKPEPTYDRPPIVRDSSEYDELCEWLIVEKGPSGVRSRTASPKT